MLGDSSPKLCAGDPCRGGVGQPVVVVDLPFGASPPVCGRAGVGVGGPGSARRADRGSGRPHMVACTARPSPLERMPAHPRHAIAVPARFRPVASAPALEASAAPEPKGFATAQLTPKRVGRCSDRTTDTLLTAETNGRSWSDRFYAHDQSEPAPLLGQAPRPDWFGHPTSRSRSDVEIKSEIKSHPDPGPRSACPQPGDRPWSTH